MVSKSSIVALPAKESRDRVAIVQVFLEDAGFDWKILGPDVSNVDYVSWVCDQDAYACSGQKCSAQSMLFIHKNWAKAGQSSSSTACLPVVVVPWLMLLGFVVHCPARQADRILPGSPQSHVGLQMGAPPQLQS